MNASTAMQPNTTTGVSRSGYDLAALGPELRRQLAQSLTPEERQVLLDHATERAFCGRFVDNHLDGLYACRLCGLPLFRSLAKFDSGSGWPSFFEPADPDHIRYVEDCSYGMVRTEIRCRRCDCHLGHVFVDGPQPTGLRYCLNSVAMSFFAGDGEPAQYIAAAMDPATSPASTP